jgi:hypothetical protein
LVTASISSIRATSKVASFARQTASGARAWDHAQRGLGVAGMASISNQMRKRVSGDQIATISGRE